MPETIDLITWQTMTPVINKIKAPNSFIFNLLFSDHESLDTEKVEIGSIDADRSIAPFVKKNGASIMVEGVGKTFATVETPNIKIKRPFSAPQYLMERQPGQANIFGGASSIREAGQVAVARDLQSMRNKIANTEEYMSALAIRGVLTYSVDEEDHFQITYGKPGGHTYALAAGQIWDHATPTTPKPEEDIMTANQLVNDATGLNITDAIMDGTTAKHLRTVLKAQGATLLDLRDLVAGQITINAAIGASGAKFIGTLAGVRLWEYSRTVKVAGSSVPLIRAKYVEFVTATPEAENKMYYGSITDWDVPGGLFVGERFTKSWIDKDPSALVHLAQSRPLPVPRRPDSMVSVQVLG